MSNKNISSNLARYFREMKNEATTHDKIFLLVSGAILVGCGIETCRVLTTLINWPGSLIYIIAVGAGICLWLMSFSLGVITRPTTWRDTFPPYQLIATTTLPSLILGIVAGCVLGSILLKVPFSKVVVTSFIGFAVVVLVMHVLFRLHTPLTRAVVQATHNPNVMTVDSHRFMWLFPALGVLALTIGYRFIAPEALEPLRYVALATALVTSVNLTGFGSGYIP